MYIQLLFQRCSIGCCYNEKSFEIKKKKFSRFYIFILYVQALYTMSRCMCPSWCLYDNQEGKWSYVNIYLFMRASSVFNFLRCYDIYYYDLCCIFIVNTFCCLWLWSVKLLYDTTKVVILIQRRKKKSNWKMCGLNNL